MDNHTPTTSNRFGHRVNQKAPRNIQMSDFTLEALPVTTVEFPITAILTESDCLYVGCANGRLIRFAMKFSDTPRLTHLHTYTENIGLDKPLSDEMLNATVEYNNINNNPDRHVENKNNQISNVSLSSLSSDESSLISTIIQSNLLPNTGPSSTSSLSPISPHNHNPPTSPSTTQQTASTSITAPTIPLPSLWKLWDQHSKNICPYHHTTPADKEAIELARSQIPPPTPLNYQTLTSPLHQLPSAITSIARCPQNQWLIVQCNQTICIYCATTLTYIDTIRVFPSTTILSTATLTPSQQHSQLFPSIASTSQHLLYEKLDKGRWVAVDPKVHKMHHQALHHRDKERQKELLKEKNREEKLAKRREKLRIKQEIRLNSNKTIRFGTSLFKQKLGKDRGDGDDDGGGAGGEERIFHDGSPNRTDNITAGRTKRTGSLGKRNGRNPIQFGISNNDNNTPFNQTKNPLDTIDDDNNKDDDDEGDEDEDEDGTDEDIDEDDSGEGTNGEDEYHNCDSHSDHDDDDDVAHTCVDCQHLTASSSHPPLPPTPTKHSEPDSTSSSPSQSTQTSPHKKVGSKRCPLHQQKNHKLSSHPPHTAPPHSSTRTAIQSPNNTIHFDHQGKKGGRGVVDRKNKNADIGVGADVGSSEEDKTTQFLHTFHHPQRVFQQTNFSISKFNAISHFSFQKRQYWNYLFNYSHMSVNNIDSDDGNNVTTISTTTTTTSTTTITTKSSTSSSAHDDTGLDISLHSPLSPVNLATNNSSTVTTPSIALSTTPSHHSTHSSLDLSTSAPTRITTRSNQSFEIQELTPFQRIALLFKTHQNKTATPFTRKLIDAAKKLTDQVSFLQFPQGPTPFGIRDATSSLPSRSNRNMKDDNKTEEQNLSGGLFSGTLSQTEVSSFCCLFANQVLHIGVVSPNSRKMIFYEAHSGVAPSNVGGNNTTSSTTATTTTTTTATTTVTTTDPTSSTSLITASPSSFSTTTTTPQSHLSTIPLNQTFCLTPATNEMVSTLPPLVSEEELEGQRELSSDIISLFKPTPEESQLRSWNDNINTLAPQTVPRIIWKLRGSFNTGDQTIIAIQFLSVYFACFATKNNCYLLNINSHTVRPALDICLETVLSSHLSVMMPDYGQGMVLSNNTNNNNATQLGGALNNNSSSFHNAPLGFNSSPPQSPTLSDASSVHSTPSSSTSSNAGRLSLAQSRSLFVGFSSTLTTRPESDHRNSTSNNNTITTPSHNTTPHSLVSPTNNLTLQSNQINSPLMASPRSLLLPSLHQSPLFGSPIQPMSLQQQTPHSLQLQNNHQPTSPFPIGSFSDIALYSTNPNSLTPKGLLNIPITFAQQGGYDGMDPQTLEQFQYNNFSDISQAHLAHNNGPLLHPLLADFYTTNSHPPTRSYSSFLGLNYHAPWYQSAHYNIYANQQYELLHGKRIGAGNGALDSGYLNNSTNNPQNDGLGLNTPKDLTFTPQPPAYVTPTTIFPAVNTPTEVLLSQLFGDQDERMNEKLLGATLFNPNDSTNNTGSNTNTAKTTAMPASTTSLNNITQSNPLSISSNNIGSLITSGSISLSSQDKYRFQHHLLRPPPSDIPISHLISHSFHYQQPTTQETLTLSLHTTYLYNALTTTSSSSTTTPTTTNTTATTTMAQNSFNTASTSSLRTSINSASSYQTQTALPTQQSGSLRHSSAITSMATSPSLNASSDLPGLAKTFSIKGPEVNPTSFTQTTTHESTISRNLSYHHKDSNSTFQALQTLISSLPDRCKNGTHPPTIQFLREGELSICFGRFLFFLRDLALDPFNSSSSEHTAYYPSIADITIDVPKVDASSHHLETTPNPIPSDHNYDNNNNNNIGTSDSAYNNNNHDPDHNATRDKQFEIIELALAPSSSHTNNHSPSSSTSLTPFQPNHNINVNVHPHIIPIAPSIQHDGTSFDGIFCSHPQQLPVTPLRISVMSELQLYTLMNWNEANAAAHYHLNAQHDPSQHNPHPRLDHSTCCLPANPYPPPPPLALTPNQLPFLPPSLADQLNSHSPSPLVTSNTGIYLLLTSIQESHLLRVDLSRTILPLPVYIPKDIYASRTTYNITSSPIIYSHVRYQLPPHLVTVPVYSSLLLNAPKNSNRNNHDNNNNNNGKSVAGVYHGTIHGSGFIKTDFHSSIKSSQSPNEPNFTPSPTLYDQTQRAMDALSEFNRDGFIDGSDYPSLSTALNNSSKSNNNNNNKSGTNFIAKTPTPGSFVSSQTGLSTREQSTNNDDLVSSQQHNNNLQQQHQQLLEDIKQDCYKFLVNAPRSNVNVNNNTTSPEPFSSSSSASSLSSASPSPSRFNSSDDPIPIDLHVLLPEDMKERLISPKQSHLLATFLLHAPFTLNYSLQYMQSIKFSFIPPFNATYNLNIQSKSNHNNHNDEENGLDGGQHTSSSHQSSSLTVATPKKEVLQLDKRSVQEQLVQSITSVYFSQSSPLCPMFAYNANLWLFQPVPTSVNESTTRFLSGLGKCTTFRQVLKKIAQQFRTHFDNGSTLFGRRIQLFSNYLCSKYGMNLHQYFYTITQDEQDRITAREGEYEKILEDKFKSIWDGVSGRRMMTALDGFNNSARIGGDTAADPNYRDRSISFLRALLLVNGQVIPGRPDAIVDFAGNVQVKAAPPLSQMIEETVLITFVEEIRIFSENLRDLISVKYGFIHYREYYNELVELTMSIIRTTIFTQIRYCIWPLLAIRSTHTEVGAQRLCDSYYNVQPSNFSMTGFQFKQDLDDEAFGQFVDLLKGYRDKLSRIDEEMKRIEGEEREQKEKQIIETVKSSDDPSKVPTSAATTTPTTPNSSNKPIPKSNHLLTTPSSTTKTTSTTPTTTTPHKPLIQFHRDLESIYKLNLIPNLHLVPMRIDYKLLGQHELELFQQPVDVFKASGTSNDLQFVYNKLITVVESSAMISQVANRVYLYRRKKIELWRNFKENLRQALEWRKVGDRLKLSAIQAKKRFGFPHPYNPIYQTQSHRDSFDHSNQNATIYGPHNSAPTTNNFSPTSVDDSAITSIDPIDIITPNARDCNTPSFTSLDYDSANNPHDHDNNNNNNISVSFSNKPQFPQSRPRHSSTRNSTNPPAAPRSLQGNSNNFSIPLVVLNEIAPTDGVFVNPSNTDEVISSYCTCFDPKTLPKPIYNILAATWTLFDSLILNLIYSEDSCEIPPCTCYHPELEMIKARLREKKLRKLKRLDVKLERERQKERPLESYGDDDGDNEDESSSEFNDYDDNDDFITSMGSPIKKSESGLNIIAPGSIRIGSQIIGSNLPVMSNHKPNTTSSSRTSSNTTNSISSTSSLTLPNSTTTQATPITTAIKETSSSSLIPPNPHLARVPTQIDSTNELNMMNYDYMYTWYRGAIDLSPTGVIESLDDKIFYLHPLIESPQRYSESSKFLQIAADQLLPLLSYCFLRANSRTLHEKRYMPYLTLRLKLFRWLFSGRAYLKSQFINGYYHEHSPTTTANTQQINDHSTNSRHNTLDHDHDKENSKSDGIIFGKNHENSGLTDEEWETQRINDFLIQNPYHLIHQVIERLNLPLFYLTQQHSVTKATHDGYYRHKPYHNQFVTNETVIPSVPFKVNNPQQQQHQEQMMALLQQQANSIANDNSIHHSPHQQHEPQHLISDKPYKNNNGNILNLTSPLSKIHSDFSTLSINEIIAILTYKPHFNPLSIIKVDLIRLTYGSDENNSESQALLNAFASIHAMADDLPSFDHLQRLQLRNNRLLSMQHVKVFGTTVQINPNRPNQNQTSGDYDGEDDPGLHSSVSSYQDRIKQIANRHNRKGAVLGASLFATPVILEEYFK